MENKNLFNLSLEEYSKHESELTTKGFTRIEQRSNLPAGSAIGTIKLFDNTPKINLIVRVGKTQAGEDYKIFVSSIKMKATDVAGKTYGNVSANFDDSMKALVLNPANWLKDCTLETVTIPRGEKTLNVTSVTSVG